MKEKTDQKLVNQAQSGDNQAFASLYRLYVGKIYAYCIVRVNIQEEAEDLTEKIFIKALKNIKKFKQQSSFKTWIYTIARNEIIDFYRRKHLTPLQLNQDVSEKNIEKESAEMIEKKQKRIEKILDNLSEEYQQVLKLRFMQNLTIKETAQILGITENNVKVRQLRALKKARMHT